MRKKQQLQGSWKFLNKRKEKDCVILQRTFLNGCKSQLKLWLLLISYMHVTTSISSFMYKFPNKHSDTVSTKQKFKYFIPGYVTVSHCETFAVYGENTGE